jgi:nicotinamidase-related amidase
MPNNTALMIVDVQVGMYEESNPVANGEELLTTLGQLIVQARETDTPIIYIQHDGGEDDLLEAGKPGFPIHPDIAPEEDDIVICKQHPDSFQGTNLQLELERLEISRIVLAGIQTDYCVDTSCRRAYSLGYDVILVQDGHSTWDTEQLKASQIIAHHNEVLGNSFSSLTAADEIQF